MTGKVARKLSFYYLRDGEKRSIEKDGESIQRTQQFLSQVAWKMGSDVRLEPRVGRYCQACDFTLYCPLAKPGILSLSLKLAGLVSSPWGLGDQTG